MAFTVFTMTFFCLPETYVPILLNRKARRLRNSTGDLRWWRPQEKQRIKLQDIVTKHLGRPLYMFIKEPMLTCISIYAAFVYALIYLILEVFLVVFREQRRYGLVISTLPFLGILVGVISALGMNALNQPFYARAVKRNNGHAVPEPRLPPMVVGGVLVSAGLFWFGWTAAPRFPWALPVVAAGFIGAGFNVVFRQCLNFLVDTYGAKYAASAVSSTTILRSILASALPVVARSMFLNMGVGPAASVLGGVSCAALPVPFLFAKYGRRLRKQSKSAVVEAG